MKALFVRVLGGVYVALCTLSAAHAAQYAPNHFLGKCLDDAWVKSIETKLSISATSRDKQNRLDHPQLHAALKTKRYSIKDPRINDVPMSKIFNSGCTSDSFKLWGVGSTVDPTTGAITDMGTVDGSLIVEYKGWGSHQLTTMVFTILVKEVLGYEISLFKNGNSILMGERMSDSDSGLCMPNHVNVEEWGRNYDKFMGHIYKAGAHTYAGRSGMYTTTKFVESGIANKKPFSADFWRDYRTSDELIKALDVDVIRNNSAYYPPTESGCADGVIGCRNSCSKTYTCAVRENTTSQNCLGLVLMYSDYDNGWVESVMANNQIPSYHCFLGWSGVESYAIDMEAKDVPVLFYHYEPDLFHVRNAGKFQRVFLPRATAELTAVNTAGFGDGGYGGNTSNPIAVDFQISTLNKFASTLVQEHTPVATLLSRFSLNDLDMTTLLKSFDTLSAKPSDAVAPDDITFSSACAWVRNNYATWKLWMERQPLCSLITHLVESFDHCADGQPREIVFAWAEPDPLDPTQSYACDGAYTLPPPIKTSRSCEWLKENKWVWLPWVIQPPPCDATFYTYNVSSCDSSAKRTATYFWLLEDPTDPTKSAECTGGTGLPESVYFDCEYTPTSTPIFQVVAALAWIQIAALGGMIFFVVKYRTEPIIKRSQYEFLIVMVVGGILTSWSAMLYAGEPSGFLCAARPLVISVAFTLIFGSLVVKSLRVYRVFMTGAMKRVVLSSYTMFKILGVFLAVDVVILLAWFIADFPSPQTQAKTMGALNGGTVDNQVCMSSSFIFSALLMFWKAIVLLMGLYLSFLIRNVSTDFQESIWIFTSSLVVLFGSIIILPMAYLVELPSLVFFAFLAFMLLGCTAMVMGMMLIPKVLRLHERQNDTTTIESTNAGGGESTNASEDTKTGTKVSKIRNPLKATTQITPVQEFRPASKKSTKSTGKSKKHKGPGATSGADDLSSSGEE